MKESVVACILLIVIIGLGIFVRFSSAAEPMWLDECHTAWTVDPDSLHAVISRSADGNQPPLYFILVWITTQLFGLSEFSLRLISLLAGSGLMIIASLWARKLTNRWSAAILAAGLIAFDGQFIFYATEARSYALVQLIGLIQAIFFWRILSSQLRHNPKTEASDSQGSIWSLVTWTLLSIAILYCHYTSAWLLLAETIVVAILASVNRKIPTRFLAAGIVIVAAMAPMLWNVSTVYNRRENWSAVSSNGLLWTDVEPWLVHWILIPCGLAFAAWMIGLIRPNTDRESQPSADWALWLWIALWAVIGPIGIAVSELSGIAPMALVRYSIVCWVAMAILATLPLKLVSPSISWGVALVILGSSFFGNWWVAEFVADKTLPVFRDEDWVATAGKLATSDPNEPVFQLADVIEDIDALSISDERFLQYLRFPVLGAKAVHGRGEEQRVIVLPTWNPQFTKQHLNLIRESKGCWLIVRGELDYALIIPDTLQRHLGEPIEFKFIVNQRMPESRVHLIHVRLKDAAANP